MRQKDIDEEIWRQVGEIRVADKPLSDYGPVRAWHGPGPHEIDDIENAKHFETNGDPSLEMFVIHREQEQRFDVHVTRIGDTKTYDELPRRTVQPISNVLPSNVFAEGDPFLPIYLQDMPYSSTHYSVYTAVCLELKPKAILEIGVRAGYSAYCMLRAVPDATYVGIDADNGTNGGMKGYYLKAIDMLQREFPRASVTINWGDSQQMITLDRHYDLVHVDGAHSHDEALHDLELVAPYADYILIDDTESIATVRSALVEFLDKYHYPAWCFDTWHGVVLIDTREAAGTTVARYNPKIFDTETMEEARSIILQDSPILGLTTDERWQRETAWTMERVKFPDGAMIFDLGCAVGRLSNPLVQRGHPVLGVDISPKMLSKAHGYINKAGPFGGVSPEMFVSLVDHGMRGQGALCVWTLQHMIPDDLNLLIPALWRALEPGAMFFTLDCNYRCVPVEMLGQPTWLRDGYDVPALIAREGFVLMETEELPEDLSPKGLATFKGWIRLK